MPKLTARKVETLKQPGMYGDGDGLYLRIGPTGAKSWILRVVVPLTSKRRDLGLGSAALVSLAEAREKARELRKFVRDGGDPDALRKREHLTFAEAAKRVHAQLLPTWKNKKHAETWLTSINTYANPHFGDRPIETVRTADVLRALTPIWTEKHETASRLKQRISTVFDWAKGSGHYPHENPVNGLKKALPIVRTADNHMAALPWQDVPNFMSDLAVREGTSARTLEFIILTGVRSGEAREARWAEFDLEAETWIIPAGRMKRPVSHRVPLCKEALAVLENVKGLDRDWVFPSRHRAKDGSAKPQSNMVFKSLYGRMKVEGFTTHGFRSAFRDWCSESAHAERELAEAALSHATGNAVERAYARSDLFERRRKLMDQWGRFAAGKDGNVVRLARA
ncbi:tyrosine-type recombinase/integrase [Acidimangrovimonas sediminis]|uniref:tyrosine-type recombinase/integrase n=1 Tax=Acidimangrovimonas sediminis TaxID=2056283 RepID=UPI000C8028BB|nr:integrase arm-type DNA-binding domain-containing protein [Acidimangrovimonas sediminis]